MVTTCRVTVRVGNMTKRRNRRTERRSSSPDQLSVKKVSVLVQWISRYTSLPMSSFPWPAFVQTVVCFIHFEIAQNLLYSHSPSMLPIQCQPLWSSAATSLQSKGLVMKDEP